MLPLQHYTFNNSGFNFSSSLNLRSMNAALKNRIDLWIRLKSLRIKNKNKTSLTWFKTAEWSVDIFVNSFQTFQQKRDKSDFKTKTNIGCASRQKLILVKSGFRLKMEWISAVAKNFNPTLSVFRSKSTNLWPGKMVAENVDGLSHDNNCFIELKIS